MNKDLNNLLKRLADRLPSCVEIYACDGDCPDQLNEGYSWKALKDAVNAVELSEIIVRNAMGAQIAWFLVSSGDEGIIDNSGVKC
tara:strand:- start:676 stop:930 length:255 start_codon:yes stop_codon:yes gene_type:complete